MNVRHLIAPVLLAGLAAAPAQAAERFSGVTERNRLVTFHSDSPGAVRGSVAIKGLGMGEQIVGIDVRPKTGQLFALSSASRQYVLADDGTATPVGAGPFAPALTGAHFGFDFNPTVDRIRVTSDSGQNLRLNPDTGGAAATDGQLRYKPEDPNAGAVPEVSGSAYTNSIQGATMTTLFNLDLAGDRLVTQAPPNDGILNTVGPLGVEASDAAGFDISPATGTAYAALVEPGQGGPRLYTVDLTTGRAKLVRRPFIRTYRRVRGGAVDPVVGLAVRGTVADDRRRPRLRISKKRSGAALAVRVGCSEACTFIVRSKGERAGGAVLAVAGSKTVRLPVAGTPRVSVSAVDAAGNRARKRG